MNSSSLLKMSTTAALLGGLACSSLAAPLSSQFTYQGRLTDGGTPANGVYDFVFSVYDAADGTLPLAGGGLAIEDVTVENGVFTVSVDFGAAVFDGSARWLEVGVRPGNETGDFTLLENRQALTAVPYALQALSARTVATGSVGAPQIAQGAVTAEKISEGNVVKSLNGLKDSVSLVAGANVSITSEANGLRIDSTAVPVPAWQLGGNTGAPGQFLGTVNASPLEIRVGNQRAAVIQPTAGGPAWVGGNDANTAGTSQAAFIGGGGTAFFPNAVAGDFGAVVGGVGNTAAGFASGVLAGSENLTESLRATIVGGRINRITQGAPHAAIVGGTGNLIRTNANEALVGGGVNNSIDVGSSQAVLAGGYFNQIGKNAGAAAVAGGLQNAISDGAARGAIGGGEQNLVQARLGIIPGGSFGSALSYGQMAHANGQFQQKGDAQAGEYILRCQTSTTAETEMFLDGSSERIKLPNDGVFAFSVLIIGSARGPAAAGYEIKGVVQNRDGNLAFIGTPAKTVLGESAAAFDARVTTTVNPTAALQVRVTSAPLLVGDNIKWVAVVRTSEVVNHN
ncbi:MAG: hypothetical protein JNL10_11190 [Verrucomicrobiales bacterium]|nr:hypothetical protein [Verrucomicrobiales bacterium]